jgi:hypothetical protein
MKDTPAWSGAQHAPGSEHWQNVRATMKARESAVRASKSAAKDDDPAKHAKAAIKTRGVCSDGRLACAIRRSLPASLGDAFSDGEDLSRNRRHAPSDRGACEGL